MNGARLLVTLVILHGLATAAPIVEAPDANDSLAKRLGNSDPFTNGVQQAASPAAMTNSTYTVSPDEEITAESLTASEFGSVKDHPPTDVTSDIPSITTLLESGETNRDELVRQISNRAIDETTPVEEEAEEERPGVVMILNVLFGVGILVILAAKFRNG